MFTGLIEEIGLVKDILKTGSGFKLEVSCQNILGDLAIGDSISIDGVCQTVTGFSGNSFDVFFSKVTAELTNLINLKKNSLVNLERAMTPVKRFGGHIVQGHVDGLGVIQNIKKDLSGIEIFIKVEVPILKYIAKKGSITTNGISLTVVDIINDCFTLYIIPETAKVTTIEKWKIGDHVNIEVDILAKYVERMLQSNNENNYNKKNNILKDKLLENGFF